MDMRRIIILSLTGLFLFLGIKLYAYDFESRGINYNILEGNHVEVTHSTYKGDVIIPAEVTYNGIIYSVTSIGSSAFFKCSDLTSITIPNTVTSIGSMAFWACDRLKSLTIPNSVTNIGSFAFIYCRGLKSLAIPNSVTNIDDLLCYGCSGLTSLTISNSVTSIGDHAFADCSGLTSITIPNSVTSIDYRAFYGCSRLISITAPNTVTYIGQSAFEGTAWYKNQPDGLLYIGKVAYAYKGAMHSNTKVIIEEGTTAITTSAFADCSGLTSITIPNSVTSIGDKAFEGCKGLTAVTIPDGVTSIATSTFYGCSSLASVSMPSSVTSIGSSSFSGCTSLTSVDIPSSVKTIGSYAFSGCKGLTAVAMHSNPESIGSNAFNNCSNIKEVTFDCEKATSLFSGRSSIEKVTMTEKVTTIDGSAFSGCSSLTSVTIGTSVTSIGSNAFYNCKGLTAVAIPNSVTSIGEYAFYQCSGLTSIMSEIQKPFNISENVFSTDTYQKATLFVPSGTESSYKSTVAWNKFNTFDIIGGLTEEDVIKIIDEYLCEIKDSYYDLALQTRTIKGNLAKDRVFVPEHNYVLDIFDDLEKHLLSFYEDMVYKREEEMLKLAKAHQEKEDLSKADIHKIMDEVSKDDREFLQSMDQSNTNSPLYTFPYYFQTGTYTCKDGGCIKVGEEVVISNETRTLSSFHSKAFDNNYNTKYVPFNITIIPDEGYRIKSLKIGNRETTETSFDSDYAGEIFVVEFEQYKKGDTNGDKEVNVSDIVEVVNYIMDNPSAIFLKANADINGDGEVNVTDIVMMVNIIMSAQTSLARTMSNRAGSMTDVDCLTIDDVTINAGETKQVSIGLNNPDKKYTAFQFDLTLPEGITIAKNSNGKLMASLDTERKDDHTLSVSEMGNNTYRLLAFSMSNAELYGTSGALVNITLEADANMDSGTNVATLKSQVFTATDGTQYKWSDLPFSIQVNENTGINEILLNGQKEGIVKVYTLTGLLLFSVPQSEFSEKWQALSSGVYIVNEQKMIKSGDSK